MAPAATAYVGNVTYKNKGEISEILAALGQETVGLKHDLEERLEKYLEDNAAELREDNRFKGLYVKRKRRSNRGSETPTPSAHGAADDFDALRTATGNLAEKALDNATQTYKDSVRPVLSSAYDEGTSMAGRAVRSGVKKAKEVTAIDENTLKLPESPTRALRSQANQAVEVAKPILEDAQDVVENVRFRALKYWRENGANELKDAVRQAQKKLSNSQTLVKVLLFSELVYLLVRLIPWNNHELQFPPSKYSFSGFARFVHGVFFWMPEYKWTIWFPEMFAMFRPSSNALGGAAMWLVYTVLPPTLISRLISFLPQPAAPVKSTKGSKSPGRPRNQARSSVFPAWDPLVFCLVRLAIVILPLTSAAPDAWRYQLEALGSTSGRALVVALTTGFVVADRLAALAE